MKIASYRHGIISLVMISMIAAGCGGSGGTTSSATGNNPPADTTAPSVSSTSPANNAVAVALNGAISATFSETMDASTVTSSAFTVKDAGNNTVAGIVNYTGTTATFTPAANLAHLTVYTATIAVGAKDLAGNALVAAYSWSFTTGIEPDTTPPAVSATSPTNNATSVAVNGAISATFNETMDASTMTSSAFTVKDAGNNAVSGTVNYTGTAATFTPASGLAYSTLYTATVTTGAKDLAGNPLTTAYSWSFTTGVAPDTTPPTVLSTRPSYKSENVPTNSSFSISFSEAMKPGTITTATILLKDGSDNAVNGTVLYSGTTATFTPSASLAYSTVYTATVTTAATDLAGNALAAYEVFPFTTAAAPNKVFVTSVTGMGDLSKWTDAGGKTGLAAADAICNARAAAAGLTGTFVAWLSDDTSDAYCRVHNLTGNTAANCGQAALPATAGPWIRTDGYPFSGTIDQLVNGVVYAPLRYDEYGNSLAPGTQMMTGTTADGIRDAAAPCGNWTSTIAQTIRWGYPEATTIGWTAFGGTGCSTAQALICFQTDAGGALPAFTSAGKRVFITSEGGTGDLGTWDSAGGATGIAAGDAVCQSLALKAGLANSARYKAWLSDSGTNAVDRITSSGPWVRLDGVRIADNKADLTDGSLFTAVTQMETGVYDALWGLWTGTSAKGLKDAATCLDWTSSSTDPGVIGIQGYADGFWTYSYESDCGYGAGRLICFED